MYSVIFVLRYVALKTTANKQRRRQWQQQQQQQRRRQWQQQQQQQQQQQRTDSIDDLFCDVESGLYHSTGVKFVLWRISTEIVGDVDCGQMRQTRMVATSRGSNQQE